MTDSIPEKLGKYKIIEEVGRGGFAAVYKAVDTTLDRVVALKVLAPHLLWDPTFVERFQREAKVAANLDHPNIVTIHEVSQVEGAYFIAMQFLEGRTLSQILEAEGPWPVSRVQAIIEQLASALDYAHARGFVHRDIKPSNIIVADEGWATLTDFGLVKAGEGTKLSTTGVVFGTPEYMSPEQAEGKVLDARSDVYSLGVVLYEMLAGRAPFVADTTPAVMYKHVHEPPPLDELPSDLPDGVVAVVEKALAKKQEARYQSAGEMGRALKQAIEARVEVMPVPPQAEVPAPPPVVEKPAEEEVVYPPVEPVAVVKEEPRPPTVAPVPKAASKKALPMGALVAGGLVLLCMLSIVIFVIFYMGPLTTPTPEPLPPTDTPTPQPTLLPGVVVVPVDKLAHTIPWLPLDRAASPGTFYFGFNMLKPPFHNRIVRQAFAAAVDRQAIADLANQLGSKNARPATTFTPFETLGRDLYGQVGISFNPERAKALLADAGYPNGQGFPEVVLITNKGGGVTSGANVEIANAVVAMWQEYLNVTVKVEVVDTNIQEYLDLLTQNAPALYRLGWAADFNDPDNFLREVFHSDSKTYKGYFSDAGFDRLVEEAATLSDPAARQSLYIQAERILCEDQAAIIPLYCVAYQAP